MVKIETIMKTIGLFCLMNECTSFLIFTPLTLNKSIFPSIFTPELSARTIVEDTAANCEQENKFGDEPGVLPPVGFWDPLKITNNVDQRLFNYLREAEQQHGRIAMLSMVILPLLDYFDKNELAINSYQNNQDFLLSNLALLGMGSIEASRIAIQYENPGIKLFRLKEDVIPGNLFNYNISQVDKSLVDKELSNGRLAMIGSLGYITQELINQHKIF